MAKYFNDGEFRLPPEEIAKPAPEFSTPKEISVPPQESKAASAPRIPNEYVSESGYQGSGKARFSMAQMLKKMVMLPVVATVAAVTVVSTAFAVDPLEIIGLYNPPGSYIMAGYLDPADSSELTGMVYSENGYDPKGSSIVETGKVPGADYDKDSNTLTLDGFYGTSIMLHNMGDDLTVKIKGYNSLGVILSESSGRECSLNFVSGSGSKGTDFLTLKPASDDSPAIVLSANGSASKVFIGENVSLSIYSSQAITAYGTSASSTLVSNVSISLSNAVESPDTPDENGVYDYRMLRSGSDPLTPITITGYKSGSGSVTFGTVTWLNDDGSLLMTEMVAFGKMPTFPGTPGKAPDAQYDYFFKGWTPDVVTVNGDATYIATYTAVPRTYTVTWRNDDGTVLETDTGVAYGTTPTYEGAIPDKSAPGVTYTFAGWTPVIAPVTGDVIYTAVFNSSDNTYTVIWQDEDGSIIETDNGVKYGDTPSFDGSIPIKASDAQYDYTFAGWSPDVSPVTGSATYTAIYNSTLRTYTVTWMNDNGVVLVTDTDVPYGTTPVYSGFTPSKVEEGVNYTFAGWTPAITPVTGDVTYTAVFSSETLTYTVTWANEDGSTLETDLAVAYGTMPEYNGAIPAKASTAQYDYTFKEWTPAISAVTGDVTYTATYNSTVRSYTVTFRNYDNSVLWSGSFAYGTTPSYGGSATPSRAETAQYRYTFAGWTPSLTAVTGAASYTATFTESLKYYTVTFMNYDNTLLWSGSFAYGSTPTYGGSTPVKPSDNANVTYVFSGWTPTLAAVSGADVYTATFDRVYSFPTLENSGPSPKEDYKVYFDYWNDEGTYDTVYAAAGRLAEATHVVDVNLGDYPQYSSVMSYDQATNTLTLNGLNDPDMTLYVVNMGDDFTIKVLGNNLIRAINAYSEGYAMSLTFTGTGRLTLGTEDNCDEVALSISGDVSTSCMMIDSKVTLDIVSCWRAFIISNSVGGECLFYDDEAVRYQGNELVLESFEGADGGSDFGPKCEFKEGVDYSSDEEFEELMQGAMHVTFSPK